MGSAHNRPVRAGGHPDKVPARGATGTLLPGTFQPTFLYESIWDLATFGLLLLIERRVRLRRGYLFAAYAALYTFGRFFTEYLRIDPAHRYLGLRLNDWTSIGVFACAASFLWLKGRPEPGDELVGDPLPARVVEMERARALAHSGATPADRPRHLAGPAQTTGPEPEAAELVADPTEVAEREAAEREAAEREAAEREAAEPEAAAGAAAGGGRAGGGRAGGGRAGGGRAGGGRAGGAEPEAAEPEAAEPEAAEPEAAEPEAAEPRRPSRRRPSRRRPSRRRPSRRRPSRRRPSRRHRTTGRRPSRSPTPSGSNLPG